MSFVPGDLENTSGNAGYVSLRNFSAGEMCVPWFFFARVLCRVGCRVADSLRLVEAMPLFERLGHTVLATLVEAMPFFQRFGHTVLVTLRDLAATLYPVQGSWCCWLGVVARTFGSWWCPELALRVWGMQNSEQGAGEVPRVICLNEIIPDGSSQPSHGLPLYLLLLLVFLVFLVGPIGLRGARRRNGRRGVGFVMSSTCRMSSLRRCRLSRRRRRSLTWLGSLRRRGGDQTELMYFVFEFGTRKGVQFCKEYYEMKNSARQEVQQAVCPEPTKEAKVRFLFRGSGRLGVQVFDGGWTLEEWFVGREEGNLAGKHGWVL